MVSIIVPVYNAEKYIERCIKSVLSQSSQSYELIIINDGSIDQTANICKKLSESIKNCIIVEQHNSGVSAARNKGLSYARGEWIVFLDSDDYLEENYVEIVEKYTSEYNIDFIFFNYTFIGEKNKSQKEKSYFYFDNKLLIENLMRKNKNNFYGVSFNSTWAKAYRREIIFGSHLCFDNKIVMGEDVLFNLSYYMQVRKFVYVNLCLYYRQISNDSLSRRFEMNLVQIDRAFHKKLYEILSFNKMLDQYTEQVKMFVLDGYLSCLKRCLFNPKNPLAYKSKVENVKKISNSKPYCEALIDKKIIRNHCNIKNRILIYFIKHEWWKIAEILIKIVK